MAKHGPQIRGWIQVVPSVCAELGRPATIAAMKTVNVSQTDGRLGKLVDEVYKGAPVSLVHKGNRVKLERYEPLDPETDSSPLAAGLLEAVRGPHSKYSLKDLDSSARRVQGRLRKR